MKVMFMHVQTSKSIPKNKIKTSLQCEYLLVNNCCEVHTYSKHEYVEQKQQGNTSKKVKLFSFWCDNKMLRNH